MDDGLVLSLIDAAMRAGAYRSLARVQPGHEGGFLKLAEKHSREVRDAAGADDDEARARHLRRAETLGAAAARLSTLLSDDDGSELEPA